MVSPLEQIILWYPVPLHKIKMIKLKSNQQCGQPY